MDCREAYEIQSVLRILPAKGTGWATLAHDRNGAGAILPKSIHRKGEDDGSVHVRIPKVGWSSEAACFLPHRCRVGYFGISSLSHLVISRRRTDKALYVAIVSELEIETALLIYDIISRSKLSCCVGSL